MSEYDDLFDTYDPAEDDSDLLLPLSNYGKIKIVGETTKANSLERVMADGSVLQFWMPKAAMEDDCIYLWAERTLLRNMKDARKKLTVDDFTDLTKEA